MERLDSSSSYFPPHPGKVKKKKVSCLWMIVKCLWVALEKGQA